MKAHLNQSEAPHESVVKALANPSLLISALGLACLYAVSQGMRITTLAGIYPVEGSLILRHVLTMLALLAVVFLLRGHRTPRLFEGKTGYLVISVLLVCALLARYSSLFVALPPMAVELGGKLTEEALCCVLVLFWARLVLEKGLVSMGATVAYAFMAQAAIQLLLSFLQRVPCAVALSLLPLASAGLYCAYLRTNRPQEGQRASLASVFADPTDTPPVSLGLAAGVVFFLAFIYGGVIFESLDAQNAMADEPLAQLCIIGGNVVAALALLFAAPHIRNYSYCIVLLLTCFASCALSMYLATFLVNKAVGGYLIASSVCLQGTRMFIWYAPFLIRQPQSSPFRSYVLLSLAFSCARVVSSSVMMLHSTYFNSLFNVLIALGMTALFCCCALVVVRSLDMARATAAANQSAAATAVVAEVSNAGATAAPEASAEAREDDGETEHRSFFRESVEALADEYGLTRQERRVLLLVAKGLNAGAIAEEMVVSVNTAKSHMRNAYAKLDVHSQQEIIALVNERKALIRDEEAE